MKPRVKIATTRTASGGRMDLYQHDRDFSIDIDGKNLMHSRRHASELELARLGCAHLADRKAPDILIGGLGMGYTLRQALDILSPHSRVVVGELLEVVVQWNREFLGVLNGHALTDKRVHIETGDIVTLISRSKDAFDAILLDIDNGPHALTDPHNDRLYGHEGIRACRRALRDQGYLAVWSAEMGKAFEQRLVRNHFHVRRFRVSAARGGNSSHYIWIAAKHEDRLPPGGGKPRLQMRDRSKTRHRKPREKG
jgi:spermidine synthase